MDRAGIETDLMAAPDDRVAIPTSNAFDSSYVVSTGQGYDGVVAVFGTNSSGGVFGSGSLLSSGRHILTAAHVVDDIFGGSGSVRFDLPGGSSQSVAVTTVTVHPDYQSSTLTNDIAILTLATDAPSSAERYDIFTGSNEIGQTHTRVGYGTAGTGSGGQVSGDSTASTIKRIGNNVYEADGDILINTFGFSVVSGTTLIFDFDNGTAANDALGVYYDLDDTGLGSSEVNSTSGDSGGPVFINGQLAGITSYGFSPFFSDINSSIDSSFGEISGDTRVSAYADWINSIIGSDSSTTVDNIIRLTSSGDVYTASSAGDTVSGGSGADTLFGLSGNDIIYGNKEVDHIYGDAGNDTLYGGQNDGPETSNGGVFAQRQGTEFVFGGDGDDVLYGNHGAEQLFGESGNDTLLGGQEGDTLSGGSGNDSLAGNRDDDFLAGGSGDDTLNGGDGTDTAVFTSNRSSYSFSSSNGTVFVSGPEGNDQLIDIENVSFADGTVSLDSLVTTTTTTTTTSGDVAGSTATSAVLTLNGSVTSSLDFDDDDDWFRLELADGDPISIQVEVHSSGSSFSFDPWIDVYNASGNVRASTLSGELTFDPSSGGTYYVGISDWITQDLTPMSYTVSAFEI